MWSFYTSLFMRDHAHPRFIMCGHTWFSHLNFRSDHACLCFARGYAWLSCFTFHTWSYLPTLYAWTHVIFTPYFQACLCFTRDHAWFHASRLSEDHAWPRFTHAHAWFSSLTFRPAQALLSRVIISYKRPTNPVCIVICTMSAIWPNPEQSTSCLISSLTTMSVTLKGSHPNKACHSTL